MRLGTFGLWDFWTFGLWDSGIFGLLDFGTFGLLDFGILDAKTFSTIKNAKGNFLTTRNAKRNLLTIKSAKAIFGILRFKPRKQAPEAQGTQSGSPRNPMGPVPQGTQGAEVPDQTTHYFGTQ